jgi:hypothetical protein
MDAFTGKEQNRANVVPVVCQFEGGKEFEDEKQAAMVILGAGG